MKILIFYSLILLMVLSIQQSSAEANGTTVELSIDKQNYNVGETIHFTLYLNSNKPLTGGLNIYTVITETRSEAYVQLLGTVPCSSCAGGRPESLNPPYSETFHRQINDPGRYYVEANFNGVAKKIFFNVTGFNETENETETETENETETNLTEAGKTESANITVINKTAIGANKENLTNEQVTEIDGIKSFGDKTVNIEEKKPYYIYILFILISILIIFAVVLIAFLARRK